jgi:thiol-disulfide isomerase/thioredoxin
MYVGSVVAPPYTHPLTSTDEHAVDATARSAWTRFTVPTSSLGPTAYILLSGKNGRQETGVGVDSERVQRPGGNQTFGCPCPAGAVTGPDEGECGPAFNVALGIEGRTTGGAPIVTGPYVLPEAYDCQVVLLDLSAEWCGPCRSMAVDAESLYQEFKDRGFVMVHAINERAPRGSGPCDQACAERWSRDFNATFPVLADVSSQAWDYYNMINAWPQSLLISRDGVVVRRFDGGQSRATLQAAIQAEVSR